MRAFSDADVVRELMIEWEHPDFNISYRSGLAYSISRVLRSLLNVFQADPFAVSATSESVGVCFFRNECRALQHYSERIEHLRIVRLDVSALGFMVGANGPLWVIRNLYAGIRALGREASISNGKSRAIPVLAWLLYKHLSSRPARPADPAKCLIANNVHPLSLAVAFGYAAKGVSVTYVEHAMTPRAAIRPLPLDDAYLLSAHTVRAWRAACPHSRTRLHCLEEESSLAPVRGPVPVNPRILICVNALDTVAAIESMIRASTVVSQAVTVRLHDADRRRSSIQSLAASLGARISLALQSSINADLDVNDLTICGNSNVVLDSLRRHKPVIYFWPNGADGFDYYGCVVHYNVAAATSEVTLRRTLEQLIAGASVDPNPGSTMTNRTPLHSRSSSAPRS